MAKNVITYAVQDLFVGAPMVMPNEHETVGSNSVFSRQNDWSLTGYTGQLSNGLPDGQSFEVLQRLNKIQDFKYSIDLPKSNINSVGSITSLDSYISGPPSVSLDFSYYVDGINNEYRMGFSTQNQIADLPISFVSGLCQKETDRKNIYLAIDSQGTEMSIRDQDADGYPARPLGHPFIPVTGILDTGAPSYNFLIFMNSYINRYSINMGVGAIPTVNVGAVADNVFFTTGVDTGFGIPYINTENAVTGFSGVSVVVPKNFVNNVNTFNYPESVFLPSQIKLTLSKRDDIYESDFSAGVPSNDGWATASSTFDYPETIGGEDSAVKITATSASAYHRAYRDAGTVAGEKYKVTAKIYIPSQASNTIRGFQFRYANGTSTPIIHPALDAWYDFSYEYTAGDEYIEDVDNGAYDGWIEFWMANSSSVDTASTFEWAGGVTPGTYDEMYIKNVVVEEVGIDFENETVQGCNIDLDLTRESVQYMGHRLPWDRPLATPIGIKADFDLLVSGGLAGNLMEDLVHNSEYDINVDFVTGGIVGMNYQLSGLRLNSTQYDSSIGSNKTASLSFSTDFDLNDESSEMPTSKGFFVSGRVIQVKDRFIYSGLSGVSDTTIFLRTGATAGLGSIQDDKDSTLYPRY